MNDINQNENTNEQGNENAKQETKVFSIRDIPKKKATVPVIILILCAFPCVVFDNLGLFFQFFATIAGSGLFVACTTFFSLRADKKEFILINALAPIIFILSTLIILIKGNGEYYRALLSILYYAIGFPTFALLRKGKSRSDITIVSAIAFGAILVGAFVSFMIGQYGAINGEAFSTLYNSIETKIVDVIRIYAEQNAQLYEALGYSTGVTVEDYANIAKELIKTFAYTLPAIFIVLCLVSSFLSACLAFLISRFTFRTVFNINSVSLGVGVVGAVIFTVCYIISAIGSLFSDSTSVFSLVTSNLYIIYLPALSYVGGRAMILNWKNRVRLSKVFGIIMIALLALDFSLAVVLLAFIGAMNTVGSWATNKIIQNKDKFQ